MTTPGFGGKILIVNLSKKPAEIIRLDTDAYAQYGGGNGTSTALFWEFSASKGDWDLQNAFDPKNMVFLMSGAISGAGIPQGSRTSVSGMSPQCYPIQWWCHSNFGGTFATMMKLAGWDGVGVMGKADKPVYINIVDDKVTIEDAKDLWGLTTWKCQEEIWKRTGVRYGQEWQQIDGGLTLQRPAICTMGAAGENMTRVASLVHGGGSGAGQGGFGGVFGSKNLKAIAVVGSGSIKIADPIALKKARDQWYRAGGGMGMMGMGGGGDVASCCAGCGQGSRMCHNRNRAYSCDSDDCAESTWFSITREQSGGKQLPQDINRKGTDIIQQLGINGMETCFQGPMSFSTSHNKEFAIQPNVPAYSALGWYMMKMYEMKIIGPGTKFPTDPLPMDKFPSQEFMEVYGRAIANREGFGKLLGEGTARLAETLGRTDDFNTLARQTMWGFMDHWSMPGVEWAYGNLLDSRDINSHDITWGGGMGGGGGNAAQSVNNYAKNTLANQPLWFDYTWQGDQAYKTGVYSKYKAEWVAWHMHYWQYFKESVGFCDWGYCSLGTGKTPNAEPAFLNAIHGKNNSFNDYMEIGRRAWNVKRAIFVMQGRHKKMENFSGYYYKPGASYCGYSASLPLLNGDNWTIQNCKELYFTREGVDAFKTHFYNVEGWDPDSGYPTRKTLEGLGLKQVADYLKSKDKLGKA
jgi:aldehyde:ferredoxin oxidoreductase